MSSVEALQLWGFEGREAPEDLLRRTMRGEVTGVSLFRHFNVDSPRQVRDLTDSLQEAAGGRELLIAIDQEGGQLRALAGSTPFAGNLALGAVDDVGLTRRVAAAIGTELRAVGVNVNYAPVADVITQPDNPSLGVRSFGGDPHLVARHVEASVQGLRDASVLSVVKHFPGKGEASVDPHHGLPVLDVDESRLNEVEFVPFAAALHAGVDGAMVGHYALPRITGLDDLPASLSSRIIGGLLRHGLGFDGLVITDALDMKALAQGGASLIEAVAALRAGTDLLLSTADYERSVGLDEGLRHAFGRGLLHADSIEASASRIQSALRRTHRTSIPQVDAVGSSSHLQLAAELARRSITLVRDSGLLPLVPTTRIASIMVRPLDLTPADTSSGDEPALADALRTHFQATTELVVGYRPLPEEIAAAVEAAREADVVVVGTITATPEQAELVRAVAAERPVVTAALRTPFDLSSYPEVETHLCTYSVLRPSLDALASVLVGRRAEGTLPVAIGSLYRLGHGLGGAV
ncbi:MAG: glycoside hydrolase family 3 protein [Actinomycetia bacterium]|nr:glycoside hydrolase family 3 protein [Actinomycetes bacterium]